MDHWGLGCYKLMQVSKYECPSDKELKYIGRKLKSCWGLSSHDEYVKLPLIKILYRENFVSYNNLAWFTGERSGRRNLSPSLRKAQKKHKVLWHLLYSYIYSSCIVANLVFHLDRKDKMFS